MARLLGCIPVLSTMPRCSSSRRATDAVEGEMPAHRATARADRSPNGRFCSTWRMKSSSRVNPSSFGAFPRCSSRDCASSSLNCRIPVVPRRSTRFNLKAALWIVGTLTPRHSAISLVENVGLVVSTLLFYHFIVQIWDSVCAYANLVGLFYCKGDW